MSNVQEYTWFAVRVCFKWASDFIKVHCVNIKMKKNKKTIYLLQTSWLKTMEEFAKMSACKIYITKEPACTMFVFAGYHRSTNQRVGLLSKRDYQKAEAIVQLLNGPFTITFIRLFSYCKHVLAGESKIESVNLFWLILVNTCHCLCTFL